MIFDLINGYHCYSVSFYEFEYKCLGGSMLSVILVLTFNVGYLLTGYWFTETDSYLIGKAHFHFFFIQVYLTLLYCTIS